MPNQAGRYSGVEIAPTGLPVYIPSSKSWTKKPYTLAVLLSRARCEHFNVPLLNNGTETPAAFIYVPNAGRKTGDSNHRYVPLYDRTDVFVNEIGLDQLAEREIVRGNETD